MDLDENNTAEGESGNKNDSERGLRARSISVQLRDTAIDALLGTPLAKKGRVKRDDVFVKNYCIKIGIEKESGGHGGLSPTSAKQQWSQICACFEKLGVTDVKEDDEGQDEDGNEYNFKNVNDDLDDGTFKTDLFVEVLAQQLDSMLPYLPVPHNPRRLDDKVIQKNWTFYGQGQCQVRPPKRKLCPILSFTLKNFPIDGKQLIELYMRCKKQHPEDDDLPTIKDMESAELYELWVNCVFHKITLPDAHVRDSATGSIITDRVSVSIHRRKGKIKDSSHHHPDYVPWDKATKRFACPETHFQPTHFVLGADPGKGDIRFTGSQVQDTCTTPKVNFRYSFAEYYQRANISLALKFDMIAMCCVW
ncbi:hypothetical protein BJ742DRAFT_774303 [Cladochytrium replicatum]|nr:hypothetical protein BJ742DRAFT_774303 [Cladochytrium replicatum]